MNISTHTLTWSVTLVTPHLFSRTKFQLTRSRGAWHYETNDITISLSFQLTRSRGAWLNFKCSKGRHYKFQLTRSRGAWLDPWWTAKTTQKFQLTRSRGAWQSNINNKQIHKNFNSHAHVERDAWNMCTIFWTYISTHTLTWSVTNFATHNNWPP